MYSFGSICKQLMLNASQLVYYILKGLYQIITSSSFLSSDFQKSSWLYSGPFEFALQEFSHPLFVQPRRIVCIDNITLWRIRSHLRNTHYLSVIFNCTKTDTSTSKSAFKHRPQYHLFLPREGRTRLIVECAQVRSHTVEKLCFGALGFLDDHSLL